MKKVVWKRATFFSWQLQLAVAVGSVRGGILQCHSGSKAEIRILSVTVNTIFYVRS